MFAKCKRLKRSGMVLIISLIFIVVFSSLSLALMEMSVVNAKVSYNHQRSNSAMNGALSALECGKYIIAAFNLNPVSDTTQDEITAEQGDAVWSALCSKVRELHLGCETESSIPDPARFADDSGDYLTTPAITYGATGETFSLTFSRYDSSPGTIVCQGTGADGQISRKVSIDFSITKDTRVLEYAVASKSRVIVTGDSTIDGDIYSTWNRPEVATPFEIEAESTINGTVNTVIAKNNYMAESDDYVGYDLETLDEEGNPVYDENGERVVSSGDKVQGQHDGVNYDQPIHQMPGFEASDYDTSSYAEATTYLELEDTTGYDNRETEYFPHSADSFNVRQNWSSRKLNRYVIEGTSDSPKVVSNRKLKAGSNALFRNCVFEGVLYLESDPGSVGEYNNVRFENCTFNGTIVTDVPDDFEWTKNVLYFTGDAMFDNQHMEEATILAPNFNVNIGNAKEVQDGSESILKGLVVGGIVDIRGNANVDGTILSMYDPSSQSGAGAYGTNVGFSNENNEAAVPLDNETGTINIHPAAGRRLPAGVKSDIVLTAQMVTYREI